MLFKEAPKVIMTALSHWQEGRWSEKLCFFYVCLVIIPSRPSDAYVCVSKLSIIGSDNGLSPGRRILLIGPIGTNFCEILIKVHAFSLKKMHLNMSSGKWRPSRPGLSVLMFSKSFFRWEDIIPKWAMRPRLIVPSWWRHQMKTFCTLLAICAGIHRPPVNSPHQGQWRTALMFSLIYVWLNSWVNNREAGDLRR